MSWGHCTSKDLIHWDYEGGIRPALKQDTDYDKDGVFTGCFYPTGPMGEDGKLTVFYTSVARLPFHWTIPYPRNAAGLAVAVSEDGGKTWTKPECNPILRGEPEGAQVTGWRDPSLSSWEEMDELRGEKSLYGIVNGGIKDDGPTSFLYAVKPDNLLDWQYVGPLLDLPRNFGPSKWWSGDWGVNLECTNVMSLAGATSSCTFLITGAEGDREKDWVKNASPAPGVPDRDVRWSLWMSGTPVATDRGPQLKHDFGGILDHGIFYAASSLQDPMSQRRVVWGWLPEEDCAESHCISRGFNGCLSIPRELFLQELSCVTDTLCTPLPDIPSISVESHADTHTVRTLGIRPLPALSSLRQRVEYSSDNVVLPTKLTTSHILPFRSTTFEMKTTISLASIDATTVVGLRILQNTNTETCTDIHFSPSTETITVDRSRSTRNTKIRTCDERGPHTLFTCLVNGLQEREKLELHLFVDKGVIEVFANDRFALATRVYTTDQDATCMSLFAEGGEGAALFEKVEVWEMGDIGLGKEVLNV